MRYLTIGRNIIVFSFLSCGNPEPASFTITKNDTAKLAVKKTDTAVPMPYNYNGSTVSTGNITPAALIAFARTLHGIPYKYGSIDPAQGFDCSGFITYVFNHFNIAVPRTSAEFTFVKHEIDLKQAKPGDLILFTGTDSTIRIVGHMGIIVSSATAPVTFIHSTSGRANGVTETPLNPYYMGRYVKIIRVFPQND